MTSPSIVRTRRPWYRVAMHYVRRAHLYFGLFLLPWAVLYGITAFLFNHPEALPDQPAASFGKEQLLGTPMELRPTPEQVASEVVAALQARAESGTTYTLVEPQSARYTRDFAFATTIKDGQEVSILFEITGTGSGGSIRSRPAPGPKNPAPPAPFATKGRPLMNDPGARRDRMPNRPPTDALLLPDSLSDRVMQSVPVVLERSGFPSGDVTVTSVPDLAFQMESNGKRWNVVYNAQTGAVTGTNVEESPRESISSELSTRRFLTRLHLAHGYPGELNTRWVWALIVDAMAFVLVFWAGSGLFMWWQIKATRWYGLAVLLLSAAAAGWLGYGMHALMTR